VHDVRVLHDDRVTRRRQQLRQDLLQRLRRLDELEVLQL
jgi:hypothetical protein